MSLNVKPAGYVPRKSRLKTTFKPFQFNQPNLLMEHDKAIKIAQQAFEKWRPKNKKDAQRIFDATLKNYPDDFDVISFWDTVSHLSSKDFFVWGHDHDFGFGLERKGFMNKRHIEIISEAIALGFLPQKLDNKRLLNIGMNTGGDLLVLAGMGAHCIGVEENTQYAGAARLLTNSLEVEADILSMSAYCDKEEWARSFDHVFCSGVLYHVTDPVLLLRILFCYLKLGGELFIETKAEAGRKGVCTYSGSVEKGANWYAPDELTVGRWFIDAGFENKDISIYRRSNGRLLVHATKNSLTGLLESQGFSRPGSWLENEN